MTVPYSEPTNEQLASFMTVYARNNPRFKHLAVNPAILEHIFETKPEYRQNALRQHRAFQQQVHELSEKMLKGELRCQHILLSGRLCPNNNVAGSYYCGLHQEDEEDE